MECKKRNILFHTDATQVLPSGLFDWSNLNVDMLSASAHKLQGPKGIGLLMLRNGVRDLLINDPSYGFKNGSIRSGTESVPLIAGFSTAIDLLNEYIDKGVKKIVALRGDLPSGFGAGTRLIHANELVTFIRKHTSDHFDIMVAAYPEIHPESDSYDSDIKFLKLKFDAGANSAITQYFFNSDAYGFYIDECKKNGIHQPIYPGIMPITNFENLVRFSKNCGAEIPRWLSHKAEALKNTPEDLQSFYIEIVSTLCEKLIAMGAPGLHFYTMNQADQSLEICKNLGIET